jgi:hypothetical protein
MPSEVRKFLFSQADEKLGKERTEQLRSDIELAADDIEKIRAVPLQVEDEP